MFSIKEPTSKKEIDDYYMLRWTLLRRPLGGKKGTEVDEFESSSIHRMIKFSSRCIGVGRAHLVDDDTAQIRYMAILSKFHKRGLGTKILSELENVLVCMKTKKIFLNSRDVAVKFYEKNGYHIINKVESPYGDIDHYRMEKDLLYIK